MISAMPQQSFSLIDRIADPMEAAMKLGDAIARSGMFGAQNVGQGVVIAFHCLQTGMPLLEYQARFHLVDGKPTKKAEAMLAAFVEDGGSYWWLDDGSSGAATIELQLPGDESARYKFSYTMEEAKQAGLVKPSSGWVKNPKAMLRARCVSGSMRMHAPHLVVGVYTPEEIEDLGDDSSPAVADANGFSQQVEPTRRGRKAKAGTEPAADATAPAGESKVTIDSTATVVSQSPSPEAPKPAQPPVESRETSQPAEQPASQPVEPTAPVAATEAVAQQPSNLTTTEQLNLIAELKQQLNLPADTWSTVLEKLGCPVDPADGKRKIKLATQDQAGHLTTWLRQQVDKARSKATTKTAEAWLDQGMPVNQVQAG